MELYSLDKNENSMLMFNYLKIFMIMISECFISQKVFEECLKNIEELFIILKKRK